jgi:hypothetical protein
MTAHPGHVLAELRKLILEEIEDQSHILETGSNFTVPDFASYKEIVGKLASLRKVIDFFEEANSIVEKRT